MKSFRSPLLHFLLVGALIFGVQLYRSKSEETTPAFRSRSISLEAERLVELATTFQRQTGHPPDAREVENMIAAEIDEEVLYREALALGFLEQDGGIQTRLIQKMLFLESGAKLEDAEDLLARAISLGLHRDDIVVRRILVQKMRLHGSRLSREDEPSEEEIAETYRARRESLREPDRRDLIHVFLSADRRGDRTLTDAESLLTQILGSEASPMDAIALGDPFPLGHRLLGRSELDLRRSFGEDFGREVFSQSIEAWSRPIVSAYGQHLVWTAKIRPGQVPALEDIAGRLRSEIERARRSEQLEAYLQRERARYTIIIEDPEVQE